MKTAIYIEDGVVQLVLTPEGEFEKNALSTFEQKPLSAILYTGSFYDCRGGWVRQKDHKPAGDYIYPTLDNEDRSLIIRMDTTAPKTCSPSAT